MSASPTSTPIPARPRGLTIRSKILAGFGGLILLMALTLAVTLYRMEDVRQVADQTIQHRQPAVQLLLQMSGELNLSTALITGYLLTGYEEYEYEFLELQEVLRNQMDRLRELEALSGQVSEAELDEIASNLSLFAGHGETLIYLREHPEENYPGLALARETINQDARNFLGLINILINSDDLDLGRPDHRLAYALLQELRYTWIQMMSNMRLFVSARGENDLKDFRTYVAEQESILKELGRLNLNLGMGELEEMIEIRRQYLAQVPDVIDIIRSRGWRTDIDFMQSEMRPVVENLRAMLGRLADEQLASSVASGQALTEDLERIRLFAGLVMLLAILGGLLIAINITRGIIPPIQNLMTAARQVADGDLNAEVYITSSDEIGMLSQSFNAMIYDLRQAALNEQQYTEELEALNLNLENRVRLRTRELERSEAKTRAVLDNIGEGILTIDARGFIKSINPAAEQMFRLEHDQAIGMHSALLLSDRMIETLAGLDDYQDERDGPFRIRERRQPAEGEGRRGDGSGFPIEFVVTAMRGADSGLRVCIVRDISARKEAEATLHEAQQKLVDAAHKSGMAEMATGVLHNIGNILNSVSLASEEILSIAENSKVSGLLKANELLAGHRDDLGAFLTRDPRGSKLPDYYIKLGDILRDEIEALGNEARSLSEKTHMMKEVISTQQAYARAGFHSERLSLTELVEDALKIQQASLHKAGVKLHRRYAEVPPCLGQKSRLLQVFTNLVKNAKEAMDDNDRHNKPKELTIEVGLGDVDHAYVRICDNGCGIDEQQLSRIFSHGFTTKQDGHGFGLHTSANALTEMKGSLQVESKGRQQGACFTVTLPVFRAA